ncbi:hypothetical protein QBC34DRAFT_419292 [Podospora aff. communis PSN243]|uniref:NAD(P)-binding domain-containing protein n=1 Tax=Podospora aff. communis PSN243 TaxID=3040156 RepID=A0AAV9G0W7_9PEZI|nr:hypothetical protein QBC34DRAFT_419292 [Podospora aff. communis PSN243]
MPSHHVLLLGGHGKVAQYLTPLLLQRSWTVTSIIRDPSQVPAVKRLSEKVEGKKGELNVLVRSIEDVKTTAQAKHIIDETKPDYIVWSAGAGGKGGPERTYAIDRDAAIHFINAAASTPSVKRFLLVSYLASRRAKPSWWSDSEWAGAEELNTKVLPHYYKAKVEADAVLYKVSRDRGAGFVGIDLRPGTLTDEPSSGKVELGKTKTASGKVSRESVARVADLLLASEGVKNSWVDLLDGEEAIDAAVSRVVSEGVDAAEGEEF